MKIVVAIKQVPARDSLLRVNADGSWIQDADLSYEINEPDAYALEEGLQQKEKHGGEVIALCAGPARAAQTIREALAKGADRAIHIEEENLGAYDPLGLARLMAAALAPEKPDLILTGLQSDDLHVPHGRPVWRGSVRGRGGYPATRMARRPMATVSDLLHEVAETHHRVYRITDGEDSDWASWYAHWLTTLSELPDLLVTPAVPSELVYLLVTLDREYTAEAREEAWEDFYARRLVEHFS